MTEYLPEGVISPSCRMMDYEQLLKTYEQHLYAEARPYRCDSGHNLHFDLGAAHGIMPREECAQGIADSSVRDIAIISRVNKPTGFYITGLERNENGETFAYLSRLERQEECRVNYIDRLKAGDIIEAKVTRTESFGAFCDIGSGIIALLPVDSISVSRIPGAQARFSAGDRIKAIVRSRDESGRILLSHKELLGTWEENASLFSVGETVTGTVRSAESYGIFVELTPNLAGLAEYTPSAVSGQSASVYIKSINPEKMKIKLIIVDTDTSPAPKRPIRYFIGSGHIDRWQYSPDCADRLIKSEF